MIMINVIGSDTVKSLTMAGPGCAERLGSATTSEDDMKSSVLPASASEA